jgi:hypothetical protein
MVATVVLVAEVHWEALPVGSELRPEPTAMGATVVPAGTVAQAVMAGLASSGSMRLRACQPQ